jgi:hypothetical protein
MVDDNKNRSDDPSKGGKDYLARVSGSSGPLQQLKVKSQEVAAKVNRFRKREEVQALEWIAKMVIILATIVAFI